MHQLNLWNGLFSEYAIDGLSQAPVQCQSAKTARLGANSDLALASGKEHLPKIYGAE